MSMLWRQALITALVLNMRVIKCFIVSGLNFIYIVAQMKIYT